MMVNATISQLKTRSKKNSFKSPKPIFEFSHSHFSHSSSDPWIFSDISTKKERKNRSILLGRCFLPALSAYSFPLEYFKTSLFSHSPFSTAYLSKTLTFTFSYLNEMSPKMNIITGTCQITDCTTGSEDLNKKHIKNLTQVYLHFIISPAEQ